MVAERIRDAIRRLRVPVSGATVTVTVSIGLATAGTEEAEAVVRRADAALYGAKQAGRDRVMVAAA